MRWQACRLSRPEAGDGRRVAAMAPRRLGKGRTERRCGPRVGLAAIVIGLVVLVPSTSAASAESLSRGATLFSSASASTSASASDRPNIVFVLTDDLSRNLVRYMPYVLALKRRGMTFTNYTVTDSLCCPSRASILTGMFPHDTQVFSNYWVDHGGYKQFQTVGDQRKTFAVALKRAGVTTGLYGKYLNGYEPLRNADGAVPNEPGWSAWGGVDSGGYGEFHYDMARNGKIFSTLGSPASRATYLTNVLSNASTSFLNSAAGSARPFLLEVASFAPHAPSVPAPHDRGSFAGLRVPRIASYNKPPRHAPGWLRGRFLGPERRHELDHAFERRVESVQAVNRMIGRLEQALRRNGQLSNTYFVFSSDNGYHMGDYGLFAGKQTAFDTDVHVPLVIAGPGIKRGSVNRNVVENIDLAPTFEQLEDVPIPKSRTDGHSFVSLLEGKKVRWRTVALIEHKRPPYSASDPDRQSPVAGTPPTYRAIRTATYTYVQYVTGAREYYNRKHDPLEMDNIYRRLTPAEKRRLAKRVATLKACSGYTACWTAAVPR
jgi:N-acetylglucosamine-6-sulfatase